jgi:hypothetical protein
MASYLFELPELLSYLVQVIAAAAYAWFLEKVVTRERYERDKTYLTVIWGVFQTGLIVAGRLVLFPLPPLSNAPQAVWWTWWYFVLSFAASGLPIVYWQVMLQSGRQREIIEYLKGGA